MEVIILAGGFGKRLKKSVSNVPKPMAPIRGTPFIELLIKFLIRQGVRRVILSLGYMADAFINYFGKSVNGIEIIYSVEDEPLGTGGALLKAYQYLSGTQTFIVLNGDTFFDINLQDIFTFHQSKKADMSMAVFRVNTEGRYDILTFNADKRVLAIGKKAAIGWANSGILMLSPHILKDFALGFRNSMISLEADLLSILVDRGDLNIYAYEGQGLFVDIGVPEDYTKAQRVIPDLG